MSGLEFVQGLAEGTLPLNTIARTLGYDVTEAASGRVVDHRAAQRQPSQSGRHRAWRFLRHAARQLHGAGCSIDAGKGPRLDHARIQDFAAAPDHAGDREIRAEGIVLTRGRRVGTAEGRITDGKGLLAHGTTTRLVFRGLMDRDDA